MRKKHTGSTQKNDLCIRARLSEYLLVCHLITSSRETLKKKNKKKKAGRKKKETKKEKQSVTHQKVKNFFPVGIMDGHSMDGHSILH